MLEVSILPKKMPLEFQNLPALLSTTTIAELLGVSRAGVTEMLKRGDLKGFQIGRYWYIHRGDFLKAVEFDDATIERVYPTKAEGRFFRWLKAQTERDDSIGDCARDTIKVSREPDTLLPMGSDKFEEWQNYFFNVRFLIDRDIFDAFYDAWEEWSGTQVERLYSDGG